MPLEHRQLKDLHHSVGEVNADSLDWGTSTPNQCAGAANIGLIGLG